MEINEYIPLVKKITNRFIGYMSKDDLYQAGLMGLFQASKKFDEKKGYKFPTFASKYIIYSIKDEIRANQTFHLPRKIIKIISFINTGVEFKIEDLMKKFNCTKEDCLTALTYQCVKTFDEQVFVSATTIFDDLMEYLSDEERKLLIMKYKYNLTQLDIAFLMNKSQTYVSKLYKNIINNLRTLYF